MRNFLILGVGLAVCISCSGCASIICGSEETINVASSPPDAQFSIKNTDGTVIAKGRTPTNVTLKRGSGWFKSGNYTVTLEKSGYESTTLPISQGLETGWYGLGNIVFGGVIGWVIVDPLTGAMYSIEDVNTSLEPQKSVFLYPENKARVITIDRIPSSLQSKMVRIN